MPTTAGTPSPREAFRNTLARRVGHPPDARAVAEASLAIWHRIAAELAPVIGVRGMDALFGRALHLASREFPWLGQPLVDELRTDPMASGCGRLQVRDGTAALEAAAALLATFTDLLATLIGNTLCERLLAPVAEAERVS